MKKVVYIITITFILIGFIGCNSGGGSSSSSGTVYSAGATFTVISGQTIQNTSGDANITTTTDADTGITTVVVNSGTVTLI